MQQQTHRTHFTGKVTGRMEILGLAVEYLGMKTPLRHRFVGRKKDLSGNFRGGTTAKTSGQGAALRTARRWFKREVGTQSCIWGLERLLWL
jgi:hypothetical protein